MTLTAADFKHGDTEFGIFYPTQYVLAVFPDDALADRAVVALHDAGFDTSDLVVATANDVLAYSHELRADPGLFARFERFLSNAFSDQAMLADELVALAREGHAFVAIHAPNDAATTRSASAVRALAPVVLRKFDALTITDLQ